MNEDRIYEIIDLLGKLEQRLENLEKLMKPRVIESKPIELPQSNLAEAYKKLADSGCMHRNFKPNQPVGISCPCPRCTPYSMSYGDQGKFSGGQLHSGGYVSDKACGLMRDKEQ